VSVPTKQRPKRLRAEAIGGRRTVLSREEIDVFAAFFRQQRLAALARESRALDSRIRAIPALIGSVPSALWQGGRAAWATKSRVLGSAIHETPVALAILLFLFVTTEVWELLGSIGIWRFLAICALFFVIAVIVLERALDAELKNVHRFSTRSSSDEIAKAAEGTPAEPFIGRIVLPEYRRIERFRLNMIQQLNIRLLLFAPLVVLVLLVALASFGFFALVGIIGLNETLTTHWLGRAPSDVWTVPFVPGNLIVTEALLRVSALLATIAALVFGVDVLREREVKDKLIGPHCWRVKQAIAAWVYYRQALENRRLNAEEAPLEGDTWSRILGAPPLTVALLFLTGAWAGSLVRRWGQ
jgi:hypothetical protein